MPLAAEVAMLTGEDVSSYGITPGDLVHVTADDIEVVSQPQPTSDGTTNAGPALPGAAGEIIVAGSFSGSRSGAGSVPRRSDSIEMRSNSGGMAMSPGRADSSPSIIASGGGMASSATAAAEAATTFRLVNAKVVGKATDRRRTHADLLSKLLFASLEAKGRAVSIRDLAASLTGAKPALR